MSPAVKITGEIPLTALDPATGPKMVDILVNDSEPLDLLPLTAVPYAIYAQQALSVPAGSITSNEIQDGTIVVSDLEPSIDLSSVLGPIDATQITISGPFTNFTGDTVQEAIQGVDSTLTSHQNTLNQLDATYVNAAGDTMSGDLTVNGNISVTGTVDGVDVGQFSSDVNSTLANHETRITSLENDTRFSDINGQIGENQIPAGLRPRAWARFVRDLAGGGGYNIVSSHNVSSVSGSSGNSITLSTSMGSTSYAVIGSGRARVGTLPGSSIQVVPFSATVSSGTQFTLVYPVSGPIEATPAITARFMPSVPCACAATRKP